MAKTVLQSVTDAIKAHLEQQGGLAISPELVAKAAIEGMRPAMSDDSRFDNLSKPAAEFNSYAQCEGYVEQGWNAFLDAILRGE